MHAAHYQLSHHHLQQQQQHQQQQLLPAHLRMAAGRVPQQQQQLPRHADAWSLSAPSTTTILPSSSSSLPSPAAYRSSASSSSSNHMPYFPTRASPSAAAAAALASYDSAEYLPRGHDEEMYASVPSYPRHMHPLQHQLYTRATAVVPQPTMLAPSWTTVDPFSLADDAAFCPLPLSTLAELHGVPEADVRLLASDLAGDSLFPGSAMVAGPPRTPSPHSSRSSSRGSGSDSAPRARAWSASSEDAISAVTPTKGAAGRAGIKIVHPSTRKEIDLRSAARRA
ncbi:hypothetical protein BC828DRAFT_408326 [Blastocladiella britannica]|nr:hypothetical protein BC828DRAFT_408326 [Blastocladiella britannica]